MFHHPGNKSVSGLYISMSRSVEGFSGGHSILCAEDLSLHYVNTLVLCKAVTRGRYVRIHNHQNEAQDDETTLDYMDLCEIQVFGSGKMTLTP